MPRQVTARVALPGGIAAAALQAGARALNQALTRAADAAAGGCAHAEESPAYRPPQATSAAPATLMPARRTAGRKGPPGAAAA